MLENEEDILVINVLTNPHAELSIEAMNAGRHILVEKPMCVTLKEEFFVDDVKVTIFKLKAIW